MTIKTEAHKSHQIPKTREKAKKQKQKRHNKTEPEKTPPKRGKNIKNNGNDGKTTS